MGKLSGGKGKRGLGERGDIQEIGIAIVAVVVVLIVCGAIGFGISWLVNQNNKHQTSRGRGDAPTGAINTDARRVYQMPDAFSNVAMFCDDKGNAVYVTTKSDYSRGMFALKDGCE